jgi:hypothetical protein
MFWNPESHKCEALAAGAVTSTHVRQLIFQASSSSTSSSSSSSKQRACNRSVEPAA